MGDLLELVSESEHKSDENANLWHALFQWSKQISNVSTLELSVASPRLHDYNDWILAIPGSYDPNRPIVKISSIKNCLNLMTSKQHPRKLTIIGADGHNYMFLLKGHEDIRQDERAMQFFGLINTLLVSNRQTTRINLSLVFCVGSLYSMMVFCWSVAIAGIGFCTSLRLR